MSRNICMFVWNHFTNDARVLRECTALSESGFSVDLICIHDPNDPSLKKHEKINNRFNVYRVRRYPLLLVLMQKLYRFLQQHKGIGILFFLVWCLLVYLLPVIVVTLTLICILLLKTKLKGLWVKGSLVLKMIKLGYKKEYDIYHSNDLNTLPQGYICSKWRSKSKKLIYDSHEVQTSRTGYSSPIYGKIEGFLIKRIDKMIVENHTRAKYNEELYGFYPYVVHNYPFKRLEDGGSIDLHSILDIPNNEKILLYQGGIQTGRGLDKLIKAAPLFNEGVLVFIGDGKIKKELQKLVLENDLSNKVKFLSKVPLADLPKYTKNGYVGFQVLNNVCFNHYSASSNKLFEYMMVGVPIIACSFPEIKRVVEGDRVGLCIDSHNYHEIAEAVNKLLSDRKLRNELSANCHIAKEKYNWEEEKIHFNEIYQSIL